MKLKIKNMKKKFASKSHRENVVLVDEEDEFLEQDVIEEM
jgi:hypothetical protein